MSDNPLHHAAGSGNAKAGNKPSGQSTDDRLTLREPSTISDKKHASSRTRIGSVLSTETAAQRTITERHCEQHEKERAQKVRMNVSGRLAPLSPIEYVARMCGAAHDPLHNPPTRTWRSLFLEYPAPCYSPLNIFNLATMQWTQWGVGNPEHMKAQMLAEQTNISLTSALLLTVAAAFWLNLVTPDGNRAEGDGDLNFPSKEPSVNWLLINALTLSCINMGASVLMSVLLMMAIEEVGDTENFLILEGWLGSAVLMPVIFTVFGIIFMMIGVLLWVFSLYSADDTGYVVGLVLSVIPFGLPVLIWAFYLCSSVWLTIANGEATLEEGIAKSERVQSITVDELRDQLEEYIILAGGVEGIELETFKMRLRVTNVPGEGEQIIKLGKVWIMDVRARTATSGTE